MRYFFIVLIVVLFIGCSQVTPGTHNVKFYSTITSNISYDGITIGIKGKNQSFLESGKDFTHTTIANDGDKIQFFVMTNHFNIPSVKLLYVVIYVDDALWFENYAYCENDIGYLYSDFESTI